jgi:hypothetical protein
MSVSFLEIKTRSPRVDRNRTVKKCPILKCVSSMFSRTAAPGSQQNSRRVHDGCQSRCNVVHTHIDSVFRNLSAKSCSTNVISTIETAARRLTEHACTQGGELSERLPLGHERLYTNQTFRLLSAARLRGTIAPVGTQYPGNNCGTNGYHDEQQEKANSLSVESFCLIPLD